MYEIVHHRLDKKIYFVQKLVLTILGDFDELVMIEVNAISSQLILKASTRKKEKNFKEFNANIIVAILAQDPPALWKCSEAPGLP